MAWFGGGVCCCWLVLLWAAAGGRAEIRYATVYWNRAEKTLQVKNTLDRSGDAYGFYNNTIQTTGWGVLEIRAGYGSQTLRNEDIMYAAGFLEGYLTAPHMYDHAANMYPQLIKNPTIRRGVQNFMAKQDQWTRQQIRNNKDDPFWRHAGYIIAQLDGLYMGALEWAKLHKQTPLSIFDVQFLNAVGDLLDLIPALFEYSTRSGQCNVELGSHGKYQWDMGHCSALIKVLPGYENIYFAHSSWFTYAATLRIYKHWNFNIVDPDTSTSRVSFSSYPGFLVSLDDFYILGSGLVMLQTTNSVFNQTLIKQVVPESLLAWQRVRIANMMADSGKTWAETFSKCNSGTYNNQYMVLDLKKVKLQKSLDDGALYIVEQIPTLVEYSDQTNVLRKDYQRDPYAEHNPCNTICCREDLNPSFPVPAGCYDSKVSDFRLASAFTATAINGPPVQGGLPVFTWRRFNHTRHQGLPDSYNFHFVTMRPIL
ncbi:phospholipase B-like 1 isoform X2 [Balearica regulorum gibbericeps]|uniref:phospholipase B-like 1 isoform X2 n=1 Tax=Balearica regulorum gibbericeps TaxID=100784 RepID=UPI003F633B38